MISILMPVYNEEKFIGEAIESVLSQTYKDFELIIVDDGSSDSTDTIIKKYLSDKRIKLIQPGKIGKNNACSLAFEESKGEYICFFHGDDLMPYNSLALRFNKLASYSDALSVTSAQLKMVSTVKRFNDVKIPKNSNKGTLTGGTVMFSREFGKKIFPIPEFLGNEDAWIVLHIKYFSKRIIHVLDIVLFYRIHEHNSFNFFEPFTKKNKSLHSRYIVYDVFLKKYRNLLNQTEIRKLSAISKAETYRFNENCMSILFMQNLEFKDKIRFFMHSNSVLYWIRMKMYRYFSGL